MFDQAAAQIARRFRQVRKILRSEGPRGITDRTRAVLAEKIRPKAISLPVRPEDVSAADITCRKRPAEPKAEPGTAISINWIMLPPAPGSGGHTTIFRIIRYLEKIGYSNRVYFYDPYRSDQKYFEEVVRRYYEFDGPVSNFDEGMNDAHAVVATSWPTAYAVFNSNCAGKRFYFVQDYEPSFYPASTASILAENTYRMGFHAITAGRWLAEKLNEEFGMAADYFEFGCDTTRYYLKPGVRRSGIAYYARQGAARRGFELGIMALELFARQRPDVELHFYGENVGSLPFKVIDHGLVTPDQLNDIYNRCYAGLSLSLTNVSLVPHEMLAAGCIPVVNDAVHNRIVLDNAFVRYAEPTPQSLAAALEAVVDDPEFEKSSHAAASSVRLATWDAAGANIDGLFKRLIQSRRPCGSRDDVIVSSQAD